MVTVLPSDDFTIERPRLGFPLVRVSDVEGDSTSATLATSDSLTGVGGVEMAFADAEKPAALPPAPAKLAAPPAAPAPPLLPTIRFFRSSNEFSVFPTLIGTVNH